MTTQPSERLAATGFARWREALSVAAVTGAAVVAGSTLFVIDPNEPGHYPTCPVLLTTGFYCPGCGALRAVHDLLHGDLMGAVARNPMAVLALPYLLLAWLAWILRIAGRPTPRSTSLPTWVLWVLLAAVVTFGVLRNVPGWTWLSPA